MKHIINSIVISLSPYIIIAFVQFDIYNPLAWLAHVPHWSKLSRFCLLVAVPSYFTGNYAISVSIFEKGKMFHEKADVPTPPAVVWLFSHVFFAAATLFIMENEYGPSCNQ